MKWPMNRITANLIFLLATLFLLSCGGDEQEAKEATQEKGDSVANSDPLSIEKSELDDCQLKKNLKRR